MLQIPRINQVLNLFCCCISIALLPKASFSQPLHPADNAAFLQNEVASVYITVNPDSLAFMLLDSNLASDYEYPATFEYRTTVDTTIIANVGFRLRGNTSRYAQKKSFKISFNSFVPGAKWNNLEKLNLNGEHNDVSILRSYLSSYLLKNAGLISARNSYVRLYVNNEYKGLYLNMEHIDENFMKLRYPADTNTGNLYKAIYGANFSYLGINQNPYESYYELSTNKSANDYSGLIHFLDVLNNTNDAEFACQIPSVLDVESYLQTLAIELLAGHWDGSTYNKNNFYLYQRPADGKFMLIEYDMDNTFGIDWFNINWATRNIYNWAPSNGNELRPLYKRILQVPYYRDRFSYYIQTYTNSFFTPTPLVNQLESKQLLIEAAALDDVYRTYDYGFSETDFLDAIHYAWGNHVKSSLEDFILDRKNAAIQQVIYSGIANPCPLGIETINTEQVQSIPVKAYTLLGQEIDPKTTNQLLIILDQFGNYHPYYAH